MVDIYAIMVSGSYLERHIMEANMTIGLRIKELRELKGMSQEELAMKLGYKSRSSINKIELGERNLTQAKIKAIADALDTTPGYIMGWDSKKQSDDHARRVIPVFGRIAAGKPLEMVEDIIGEVDISYLPAGGEYFALQAEGHSMEPAIKNGDIVICRKQDDVENGEIAVVAVNGDDATCKRVYKYRDSIQLMAINSEYEPIMIQNGEKPVRILGKVMESRHKYY